MDPLVRIPQDTVERLDRLMPALRADPEMASTRVSRTAVVRAALLEGLTVLEAKYLASPDRKGDNDMRVDIFKDAGFDEGAWRARIELRGRAKRQFEQNPFPFSLPRLKHRSIVVDRPYLAPVPQRSGGFELQGVFVDGVWTACVYTNGVSEADNETPIRAVADALEASVRSTLAAMPD
jgi:hypothetical protein